MYITGFLRLVKKGTAITQAREHNSHFTVIYTLMQDVARQGDEDISKMEFGTFSSLLSVNGKTKEIHV